MLTPQGNLKAVGSEQFLQYKANCGRHANIEVNDSVHAVEVPEGSRLLYISREVGVLPDGTVPQGMLRPRPAGGI
jgi:hypothetical protein